MKSIFWIYDYLLEKKIKKQKTPDHIGIVLDSKEFEKLDIDKFIDWSSEFDIQLISIYISLDTKTEKTDIDIPFDNHKNRRNDQGYKNDIIYKDKNEVSINISFGLGGRKEFIDVLKTLGREIKKGNIDIEDIDREIIEEKLIFDGEPDLLIKTGEEHLTDFMLWQSVYSEHYFADFDWKNLRKRDFLRTIREYQNRERRYGR